MVREVHEDAVAGEGDREQLVERPVQIGQEEMALGAGNRARITAFSHRGRFPTPAGAAGSRTCARVQLGCEGEPCPPTSVRRPQVGEQARQLVREDIDEGRDPDPAQLQASGTPSAAQPPVTASPTALSEDLAPHTKDASRAAEGEEARSATAPAHQVSAHIARAGRSQLRRAPSRRFRGSRSPPWPLRRGATAPRS